jgi:hypothetical protein
MLTIGGTLEEALGLVREENRRLVSSRSLVETGDDAAR